LNKTIRVLNFDDSVIRQERLLAEYDAEIVDLKDLAPAARFWMDEKTKKEIASRVGSSSKMGITFLGSGDFHHVSNILINASSEPVTVINIDFHPDWGIFPRSLGCGSWVTETLKNDRVKKFLLLGMCSESAVSFSSQTGNYASLKNDRVEIYPWAQCPSRVFFRKIPQNKSIKTETRGIFTKVYWNELKGKNLTEFLLRVLRTVSAKRVYISIDKDCLGKKFSLTNWQEGQLSLDDLFLMLKVIKQEMDIVGVDVTGDYSDISVRGVVKNIVSGFNHPKNFSAKGFSKSDVIRVNEDTNLEIVKFLMG